MDENKCHICGSMFASRKRGAKYCSRKCQVESLIRRNKTLKGQRRVEYIERVCPVCGKKRHIMPALHDKAERYCSRKCADIGHSQRMTADSNSNWKGGLRSFVCAVCGKPYKVHLYRATHTSTRFCSRSCASVYNVRHNMKRAGLDIEVIFEAELNRRCIKYSTQVLIGEAKTVVDFVVGKTAIYCDGDYWHSFPKTIIRDAKQDQSLLEMGYSVFRFKGSEIKKDIGKCVDKCFSQS